MKVTFCAYDGHNCINGVNTWLRRLLPVLRDRGIDSQVLFVTWAAEEQCATLPILRQMGFECLVAPSPYYTERHAHWILKTLSEHPPDVFIPNYMLPALYAARWVRAAGIPTVGVLHNDDDEYRAIQSRFIFGDVNYQLSAVVGVSQVLEHQVLDGHPANTLVRRIPCGVPLPQQVTHAPSSRFKLMYVGRLVEKQKRISEVTHALCRVVKKVSATEAAIYGSGPDYPSVEKILKEQRKDLPIRLAGFVDSETIQACLLESHALVLLSDYEGLPVSVMEAMACGVVPICLCIKSGIPELVRDEVNGLLVNDRGDDFIKAVQRLKQEPELWQRLSQTARATIETEYSCEVGADRWAELLRSLNTTYRLRQKIRVPSRLTLPPVHPHLINEDPREPAIHAKILQKSRMVAGGFKHRLLGT